MAQHRVTIAVAGNPNSGKTSLFNALTGANQKVGNYPGVTVEKKEGQRRLGDLTLHFVDLPGTYSLNTFSLDEVVARDYIVDERPQVVLDVVDASNLERNLYLSLQLAEMGVPMVMALNMSDVAEQRGQQIDCAALSERLGVPVVPTVGNRRDGIDQLLATLQAVATGQRAASPKTVPYGPVLEPVVDRLSEALAADQAIQADGLSRWLAIKLLEQDPRIGERIRQQSPDGHASLAQASQAASDLQERQEDDAPTLIAEQRYAEASQLVRQVLTRGEAKDTLTDRIDRVLCHRALGLAFVALAVYATFSLTFQLADGWAWIPWIDGWETPCGVLGWFFDVYLLSLFDWLPSGPLRSLLVDGIIGGVGGVISFVPIIFFMFLLLALIEDSGYVSRIAFVLDRVLRTFGLQGKSILAMIVSGGIAGGCAVPGVMATRTLNDERDRLTTMLVAPFMNCGAKIPVFAMLIAAFFAEYQGIMMWLLVVIAWTVALLAALTLRKSIIRGVESPFVMELPPYHLPTAGAVVRNAFQRSWSYVRKAGTVILAVSVVLWAMMYFPRTDQTHVERQQAELAETTAAAATPLALAHHLSPAELPHMVTFTQQVAQASQPQRDLLKRTSPQRFMLAQAALGEADFSLYPHLRAPGQLLADYIGTSQEIERLAAAAQLRGSIAGIIGRSLEPLSRYAGFDWKDNIALTGGFAAKEVIVSTMGTAYSMGSVEPIETIAENQQGNPLARRIASDPEWNRLRAFSLIIFVMFYAPCLVTTSVIWRESGHWKWALFATTYSTILAFVLSVLVYQVGQFLGLGL